jgi:acyl-CoA synthetase (AMP-forming)/AMP-acid ligase II
MATVSVDALVQRANARVGKQQRIASAVYVEELPRHPNGKMLESERRKHYAHLGDGPT